MTRRLWKNTGMLMKIMPGLSSDEKERDFAVGMPRGLVGMGDMFAQVEIETLRELEKLRDW